MSFRDDITAEFRLEFQSRDFGNSIQRCQTFRFAELYPIFYIIFYIYNMYIIYSIHIYISNEIFSLFFAKTFLSLDYFVSSNTCNFKRFENGRGSTSTGGSTTASILRFSFLRIVRYRTTNFVSIEKRSVYSNGARQRITEKWRKKGGRSGDGEVTLREMKKVEGGEK